jgi:hypothetical protein
MSIPAATGSFAMVEDFGANSASWKIEGGDNSDDSQIRFTGYSCGLPVFRDLGQGAAVRHEQSKLQ